MSMAVLSVATLLVVSQTAAVLVIAPTIAASIEGR
jgi:hypothetical protein